MMSRNSGPDRGGVAYGAADEASAVKPTRRTFAEGEECNLWLRFFSSSYRKAWDEHAAAMAAKSEAEAKARVDEAAAAAALREQQVADLHEYFELLESMIRLHSNTLTSFTVAQQKGGAGKTPTVCYVASELGELSRRTVVLFDHNQMQGTTGDQLGLGQAVGGLQSREAARLFKEGQLLDSGSFLSRLPVTKHGVTVVTSEKVVEEGDFYGENVSGTNIVNGRKHVQFIGNDTDNGTQAPAMRGVLMNTDVLLVPTLTDEVTLRMTREQMRQNLTKWGYADLVQRSITIVTGIRPGDELENYRNKLELSDSDVLLAVPFDERIFMKEPVDLDVTDFYVRLAYREIALALLYSSSAKTLPAAAKLLQSIRSGQLVQLPSGRTPVLPWVDGSDRLIT